MGATAALIVAGKEVKVTRQRGQAVPTQWGGQTPWTIHPSALLRLPDGVDRDAKFHRLVADLKKGRRG